jgi:hypothetical protein
MEKPGSDAGLFCFLAHHGRVHTLSLFTAAHPGRPAPAFPALDGRVKPGHGDVYKGRSDSGFFCAMQYLRYIARLRDS